MAFVIAGPTGSFAAVSVVRMQSAKYHVQLLHLSVFQSCLPAGFREQYPDAAQPVEQVAIQKMVGSRDLEDSLLVLVYQTHYLCNREEFNSKINYLLIGFLDIDTAHIERSAC